MKLLAIVGAITRYHMFVIGYSAAPSACNMNLKEPRTEAAAGGA